MATFLVCLQCGRVREVDVADQLPDGWQRSDNALFCGRCAGTHGGTASDVDDDEVVSPAGDVAGTEDTLEERLCEVCSGPCRGH